MQLVDLEAAVADHVHRLGEDHPETLSARLRLARRYREHERDDEAVTELEAVVAGRERLLGDDHPDTSAARHELSAAYFAKGLGVQDAWLPDAVAQAERAAEGRERVLGLAHPDTLASLERAHLFRGMLEQGNPGGYIGAAASAQRIVEGWEQVVADRERALGPDAPGTQFARVALADAYDRVGRGYDRVGRGDDRRALLVRVAESWGRLAADRADQFGPVHPDTVEAREQHANAHDHVGRSAEATALLEAIAADHVRLLGAAHPQTLRARAALVERYALRDPGRAVELGEPLVEQVWAVLGPDDPVVRQVVVGLIIAHQQTGNLEAGLALAGRYPVLDVDDEESDV
jgi:hypothetical protein